MVKIRFEYIGTKLEKDLESIMFKIMLKIYWNKLK